MHAARSSICVTQQATRILSVKTGQLHSCMLCLGYDNELFLALILNIVPLSHSIFIFVHPTLGCKRVRCSF